MAAFLVNIWPKLRNFTSLNLIQFGKLALGHVVFDKGALTSYKAEFQSFLARYVVFRFSFVSLLYQYGLFSSIKGNFILLKMHISSTNGLSVTSEQSLNPVLVSSQYYGRIFGQYSIKNSKFRISEFNSIRETLYLVMTCLIKEH